MADRFFKFKSETVDFYITFIVLIALALDAMFGEVSRYHPLVGFGRFAHRLEAKLNLKPRANLGAGRWPGVMAWCCAVLPFLLVAMLFSHLFKESYLGGVLDAGLLYLAIGFRSLKEHAQAIAIPLVAGDLAQARQRLSWIVSRDTEQLEASAVSKATIESVLENGADALFCAIFWFVVAGAPGVVLYRLSNTLDAMWGYKNQRFLHFGWFAARMDDVLNYLPARITALAYALVGRTFSALKCWKIQAPQWKSPNAGPVMASGAGALQLKLGGEAVYEGLPQGRPMLGTGCEAQPQDIQRALLLVRNATVVWLSLIFAGEILLWGLGCR